MQDGGSEVLKSKAGWTHELHQSFLIVSTPSGGWGHARSCVKRGRRCSARGFQRGEAPTALGKWAAKDGIPTRKALDGWQESPAAPRCWGRVQGVRGPSHSGCVPGGSRMRARGCLGLPVQGCGDCASAFPSATGRQECFPAPLGGSSRSCP